MDDNKITTNDFNYDIYSGGSTDNGSSGVTSSDFDYDVYSGTNAMEYLRQENERKRAEREQANKSEAELKREEYEKKFRNMSADELFAAPKKKKPEDDFSDFFDADEIERQREHQKKMEEELRSTRTTVENMMPGEDDPSSQPLDSGRAQAIETVAEMMAHGAFQREREMDSYHYAMRHRNSSGWFLRQITDAIFDSLCVGEKGRSVMDAITWYIAFFVAGSLLYVPYSYLKFGKLKSMFLVWGAASGLAAAFVRRFFLEKDSFLKSLVNCTIEFLILVVLVVLVIGLKMK